MKTITIWWVIVDRSAYGVGGNWNYFRTKEAAELFQAEQSEYTTAELREGDAVEIDGEIYFPPKKVDFVA